ncbi:unnamed protein product [Prorocentrum cordatum]|uniref:Uncharacterized protein n=2 Tax=Prorocentrum cordatum TaxID=2364126 RepID=A0ABN9YFY2_9DINO|nr:unnamed protein product [Polarella glacialis]
MARIRAPLRPAPSWLAARTGGPRHERPVGARRAGRCTRCGGKRLGVAPARGPAACPIGLGARPRVGQRGHGRCGGGGATENQREGGEGRGLCCSQRALSQGTLWPGRVPRPLGSHAANRTTKTARPAFVRHLPAGNGARTSGEPRGEQNRDASHPGARAGRPASQAQAADTTLARSFSHLRAASRSWRRRAFRCSSWNSRAGSDPTSASCSLGFGVPSACQVFALTLSWLISESSPSLSRSAWYTAASTSAFSSAAPSTVLPSMPFFWLSRPAHSHFTSAILSSPSSSWASTLSCSCCWAAILISFAISSRKSSIVNVSAWPCSSHGIPSSVAARVICSARLTAFAKSSSSSGRSCSSIC